MGFNKGQTPSRYPCWLYREDTSPIVVSDEGAEKAAREKGYDSVTAASLSNRQLINWFWDLEDFSAKQLRIFALEEFGVDLPEEASQEKLFQAVIELTKYAPQNQNRLVLMAHTIQMNYDETQEEIKRLMEIPQDANVETFSEEVIM